MALKYVTWNYYIHLFIQVKVPIPVGKTRTNFARYCATLFYTFCAFPDL